jgi:hypothetical protein
MRKEASMKIWVHRRRVFRRRHWAITGAGLGLVAGGLMLGLAGISGAEAGQRLGDTPFLDVGHFPPKLRAAGEPAQLRFEIRCVPPDGDVETSLASCNGAGTVYVRAGTSGSFTAVPLQLDPSAVEDPYYANVPSGIASSPAGFQYYAVLRDIAHGLTKTLPPGGANAPLRSLPLGPGAVTVDLGVHTFGSTRSRDARAASASWGSGVGEAGLDPGARTPVGATSFDVRPNIDGLFLLDEANKRVLKFTGGIPTAIPLPALSGVPADLAVGGDGKLYVLEEPSVSQPTPRLMSFTAAGGLLGTVTSAEGLAPRVRLTGSTAYVQQYPSSQWMPAMDSNGTRSLALAEQVAGGLPGRPAANGAQTLALSTGGEVRVAFVNPTGWSAVRVLSGTPVADIQIAERTPGGSTVLVFSVYSETQHEYEVIVLSPQGSVVRQFAVPAFEYSDGATTAFRLAGSSLYALGSTSSGVFVDRYDLGVS